MKSDGQKPHYFGKLTIKFCIATEHPNLHVSLSVKKYVVAYHGNEKVRSKIEKVPIGRA